MGKSRTNADRKVDLFGALDGEVAELLLLWRVFRRLYGFSEDRVGVLNRHLGRFFGLTEYLLRDMAILTLARLLDPGEMGGRAKRTNVSILRAIDELKLQKSDPSSKHIASQLKQLRKTAKPIVAHRNRRIAHNDCATKLRESLLPGVPIARMEKAVREVAALVSDISVAAGRGEVVFDGITEAEEYTVDVLENVIRAGNAQLEAERRAKYKRQVANNGAHQPARRLMPSKAAVL